MKKIEWENDNKMLFESPFKTFNRQTTCIGTGNQIGDTVISSYIRSKKETKCNGEQFGIEHLQNFDLETFRDLPNYIREWIKNRDKDEDIILYEFRHWNRNKLYENKIIDGYVATTSEYNKYKLLNVWYMNKSWKAKKAIDEAVKYITV